jgi:hypothetical protein
MITNAVSTLWVSRARVQSFQSNKAPDHRCILGEGGEIAPRIN